MRRILTVAMAAAAVSLSAETHEVTEYLYVGPSAVSAPLMVDTVDVNGKPYDVASLIEAAWSPDLLRQGTPWMDCALPSSPEGSRYALHQLGFMLSNTSYTQTELKLEQAPAKYRMFLDGNPSGPGTLTLEPGNHEVVIKYLSDAEAEQKDSLRITYTDSLTEVLCGVKGALPELYTIQRMMTSRLSYTPQISPRGDYMLVTDYQRAARNRYNFYLVERATGRRTRLQGTVHWMPRSNRYYLTREGREGKELVTIDPATGDEQIMAKHLPEGEFTFAPTEDYLVYTDAVDGPKELNRDVFEVLNPEDRQPGWRNRRALSVYDLSTGVKRPITFGSSSYWLSDISADGRYLLLGKSEHCFRPLGEAQRVERPVRPHDVNSYYRVDVQTLAVDTLITGDGFVGSIGFSPDGKQLLVMGSPEAFGRIGCTLPDDRIPSMFDYQLYLMDVQSREVRPMTRDFDPSIASLDWSLADGMIYFTANNRDSVSLYRMEPRSGAIQMIDLPEEVVKGFSLSSQTKVMVLNAQSATNSDRLYSLDLAKLKPVKGTQHLSAQTFCFEDISAENLQDLAVAECNAWTYRNSNGDDVLCRYYVPVGYQELADGRLERIRTANVVEEGTIPMITYYYGGCSPTERNFESSYPWQCWAAMGYAVLVVEPSGAAGFGQEWAARHVNTAGADPARDIIEAVREFSRTHTYINKDKIGCCGASYGGFMTQYMQTLENSPFACAISHAGISDHTTYWGFGYWGYSYSEVSMANSYPWSETDLYVQNSPIYRADKIDTPILFLHGTKDVNVPLNNSIQLFTALKLLGRETAMVCVEGEDHGVVDYDKRIAWLKTQLAWFQKYLKDDASWWDALYPKKNL